MVFVPFNRRNDEEEKKVEIMNDVVQDEEVDEEKNLHDEQRTDLTLLPIINYLENNSLPKDLEGRVIDMNISERSKDFEMK